MRRVAFLKELHGVTLRRRAGQVDVSQRGNWSQVRNAMFQDEVLQARLLQVSLPWAMAGAHHLGMAPSRGGQVAARLLQLKTAAPRPRYYLNHFSLSIRHVFKCFQYFPCFQSVFFISESYSLSLGARVLDAETFQRILIALQEQRKWTCGQCV